MIHAYLNQTATRKPKTGFDAYGKRIKGDGVSFSLRFQHTQKLIKNANGDEIMIDGKAWISHTQTMKENDIITFEGIDYNVISVATKRDLDGEIDHKKLFLGKVQ